MELFADISHKARQRQRCAAPLSAASVAHEKDKQRNRRKPRRCAALLSAASVAHEEDKQRNRRKPRHVRNVCLPEPKQQTRKVPSFSEFDDYSLFVESMNNGGGDGSVIVNDGHISGGNGNLNVSAGGHKQQEQRYCAETLDYCNSNTELLSHATHELRELRCQQNSTRCSAGYVSLSASTQQCVITPAGLVTSTPHPRSAMGMSHKMYSDLVHGTSQLLLSDVSADGEIGTCR